MVRTTRTKTSTMTMATRDIVAQFVRTHLQQKGHAWPPNRRNNNGQQLDNSTNTNHDNDDDDDDDETSSPNNQNQVINNSRSSSSNQTREVCQILTKISKELQEFIRQTNNEKFIAMTNELLDNFYYEAFREEADELFAEKIVWNHIVTFLLNGAECACRAIETRDNESSREMVSQLIDWMCKYVDDNLSQWINEQDGAWMNVKVFEQERYVMAQENSHYLLGYSRGMRHYLGMAAFAALVAYTVNFISKAKV